MAILPRSVPAEPLESPEKPGPYAILKNSRRMASTAHTHLNGNGIGNGGRRSMLVPAILLLAIIVAATMLITRKGTALIRADRVQRGSLTATISTNGKVEPVVDFQAHAPISTTVQKVYVKPGDHVKKGQLLLTLDDASVRAQS